MRASVGRLAAGLALVALACSPGSTGQSAEPAGSDPLPDTRAADSAQLVRLESDARSLAHVNGCSADGECRTAPVGWKACGGPRSYLVYCARSTDSVALFAKLEELRKAEQAYNRAHHIVSTCELRLPPTPTVAGGRCTAGD